MEGHPNLLFLEALGRLYSIHSNNPELYYLRLLLISVHGPTSFQEMRILNSQVCDTYRKACQELNLLDKRCTFG